MRRRSIIAVIAGLATIGSCLLKLVSSASAQESSPPAGTPEVEIATGVTFGAIPASEDPPTLYRLRLAPGATLSFAGDPAISLVYVESGTLALRLDAPVSDARPDETTGEEETGREVTVRQEDYFVLPPLVAGEIRNDGQEPASIVIAAITPGLFPAPAASTPAPE